MKGRKKHATSTSSCSRYSSSASTILNTRLLRFLILSACGDLMYSSTICFQRRRHNQPRKKLCTFLIFLNSMESCTDSHKLDNSGSSANSHPVLKLPRPTGVELRLVRDSLRKTQICKKATNVALNVVLFTKYVTLLSGERRANFRRNVNLFLSLRYEVEKEGSENYVTYFVISP